MYSRCRKLTNVLAFATLGTAVAVPALAQGFQRRDSLTDASVAFNPKPDPIADFALPLPCGGTLVLRAVCSAGAGYLDDVQVDIGCAAGECERDGQSYMEASRPVGVAGSFALGNLPAAWQQQLKGQAGQYCQEQKGRTPLYYLVGKYEITNYQWKLVMSDICPPAGQPLAADDPQPKTSVSWFEAVDFGRRYTEWLLREQPQTLPFVSPNEPGTIRLPTEAEWEFASRGGQMVKIDPAKDPVFPLAAGKSLQDYAVFRFPGRAQDPDLASVGSRLPNPLGLYDTAGNAAEMTLESFSFSFGRHVHGLSGGFVRKGGSYMNEKAQVVPGRREEKAYFERSGPLRQKDLGFRIVLAGLAMPNDARRAETINGEWSQLRQSLARTQDQQPDPSTDLLAQIDQLQQAKSVGDESYKRVIASLKSTIEQDNAALRKEKGESTRMTAQNAVFTLDSVRNYWIRKINVQLDIDKTRNLVKSLKERRDIEAANNSIEKLMHVTGALDVAIDEAASLYVRHINGLVGVPEDILEPQLLALADDIDRQGTFGREVLRKRYDSVKRHLSAARRGQRPTVKSIKDELLK